jgi:hypothetical protein
MAVMSLTAGNDHLSGVPGENNVFFGSPSTLDSLDTVVGITSTVYTDTFVATDPGTFTLAQFANVAGMESIHLSPGGNFIWLDNRLAAETSLFILPVLGNSGNDRIDASAVTNGRRIALYAGTGDDVLIGGNGNDYFAFTSAALTAADVVAGGRGFDYLDLISARVRSIMSAASMRCC